MDFEILLSNPVAQGGPFIIINFAPWLIYATLPHVGHTYKNENLVVSQPSGFTISMHLVSTGARREGGSMSSSALG